MTPLDWITAIASSATAIGVIIAVVQLWHAEKLAAAEFENELRREYRELCAILPVKAFLGDELSELELSESVGGFLQYFHLTTSQVFLREQGRISTPTWELWARGIDGNFQLPAFCQAWAFAQSRATKHRLTRLERFLAGERDPRKWTDQASP